jgi:hypothetical protein
MKLDRLAAVLWLALLAILYLTWCRPDGLP